MRTPSVLLSRAGRIVFTVLILGSILGATSQQTSGKPPMLGVQSHFAQGWPERHLDLVRHAGAPSLRDSLPWSRVETVPGRYDLATPASAVLDKFCSKGGTLLLTAVPLNPLYDGGGALRSVAAKAAFVRYLLALQEHFGPCLVAIEVGNEINATNSRQLYRTGETGTDPLHEHVALVRSIRDAFRASNVYTRILGGSSNMVATGFLDSLFARGLLEAADGIAVHPYRSQADNLDGELAHLTAVMRRHGRTLPIWATEFSDNFPQADHASPHLVKAATLLAASDVEAAYWYALVDQKWFHNMGLYRRDEKPKPAAAAFRLVQDELFSRGRPQGIDTGDAQVRLYRFGTDAWVAWGASGTIAFDPGARLLDSGGQPLPGPGLPLTDAPVIAIGSASYRLTPGRVIADSLLGYSSTGWRYLARKADGSEHELGWLDGQWSTRRGDRFLRPLWIGDVGGAPTGSGSGAVHAIVRYTAPVGQTVAVAACLDKRTGGDGIDVAIHHGKIALASTVVTGRQHFLLHGIVLAAGDTLDLVIGPHARPGNDTFRYRIRIAAEPADVGADCPARPARA